MRYCKEGQSEQCHIFSHSAFKLQVCLVNSVQFSLVQETSLAVWFQNVLWQTPGGTVCLKTEGLHRKTTGHINNNRKTIFRCENKTKPFSSSVNLNKRR